VKNILTVLTAVILFAFSFTFSSCKNCNGNKGKDNSVIDRDQNPDNPATDADGSVPALDGTALSEVEKHLRAHGASDAEIEATKHIATEHFGKKIGRIMWDNGHFWYRDDAGDHNGQPVGDGINCGPYALKRLLFVLGRHNIVDKNLWYQRTDMELREYVSGKYRPGFERFYNETMSVHTLTKLIQKLVGNTSDYSWVYNKHNKVMLM
jgi:hypothetical protein